jgi:ClpP class serine protease
MSFADLFWILLLLVLAQPFLMRRYLEAMRARKIAEIERERGSRVILMVHRQETMSLFGFPLMRFIDIHDAEQVLRAIQMTDDEVPLDLVLHTPGGLVLAATQIARAVEAHKGRVTIFVPHMAMSGGTLIALAADEIVMCEHSVLGPMDPQVGQLPAASILRAVEAKSAREVEDETLIKADLGNMAIQQLRRTAERLLEGKMEKAKIELLASALTEGRWTHDHPIFPDEAAALGLNVSTEMPDSVLELMSLFPQPGAQVQNVEYIPQPRREGPGKGR